MDKLYKSQEAQNPKKSGRSILKLPDDGRLAGLPLVVAGAVLVARRLVLEGVDEVAEEGDQRPEYPQEEVPEGLERQDQPRARMIKIILMAQPPISLLTLGKGASPLSARGSC